MKNSLAAVLLISSLFLSSFAFAEEGAGGIAETLFNEFTPLNQCRFDLGYSYEKNNKDYSDTNTAANTVTKIQTEDAIQNVYLNAEHGLLDYLSIEASLKYETRTYGYKAGIGTTTTAPTLTDTGWTDSGIKGFELNPKYHREMGGMAFFFQLPFEYSLHEATLDPGKTAVATDVAKWSLNPKIGVSNNSSKLNLGVQVGYLLNHEGILTSNNSPIQYKVTGGNTWQADLYVEENEYSCHPGFVLSYIMPKNVKVATSTNNGSSFNNGTDTAQLRELAGKVYAKVGLIEKTELVPQFTYFHSLKDEINGLKVDSDSHYLIDVSLRYHM